MASVMMPQKKKDGLSTAMSVGSLAGSIMGMVPSGGLSLLGAPGAIKGMQNKPGQTDIPSSPMQRRMQQKGAGNSDMEILKTLQQGEIALNEMRKTDPQKAQELQQPIYDAMLEADRRLKKYGSITNIG